MTRLRHAGLLVSAALFVACGGGGATSAPSTPVVSQPPVASVGPSVVPSVGTPRDAPSTAPSSGPTSEPGASLDPSLSDAGIVARVTITNDTRGGRDGTHDIIGVDADGSECSGAFEDDYVVVAWYDDAPIGQIHRFSVSVAHADVPAEDGSTTDIEDGGVSFDFVSESGFGTQYTGNATRENEGSATIDVTRAGTSLTFDFEGVTNDGVNFAGQMICSET